MKKLHLENVEERKDFKSPTAGGYVFGVLAVEDVPEKEYIKISYDIVEGEFTKYYTNLVKEGVMKSLPILYASYKDKALPIFKGTITAFEKSNKGFKWADDETKLKGKKFGGVLAEEEYEKDGKVKTSLKISRVHSVEAIKSGDFEVPEIKKLAQLQSTASNPFDTPAKSGDTENLFGEESTSDGFMDIPDDAGDEEDFPFN